MHRLIPASRIVAAVLLLLVAAAFAWTQPLPIVQLRSLTQDYMTATAVYSPYGTYLAVQARSNRVIVYDSDYHELWRYHGQGDHGAGSAVVFTSDEKYMITPGAGGETTLAVLDAATGELVTTMEGHQNRILHLTTSPDGQWLVSTGRNGETIIWKRNADNPDSPDAPFSLHQRLERSTLTGTSLAFAPGSDAFALGNQRDFVELYTLNSAGADPEFELRLELHPRQQYGNTGYLDGMSFSPDGRWFAVGVRDEITIWEWQSFEDQPAQVISDIDDGTTFSVLFSHDSQWLFGGFFASRIGVWHLENGTWRRNGGAQDNQDYVWGLALSPDGTNLASVSTTSNGVVIWGLEGMEPSALVQVGQLLARAAGATDDPTPMAMGAAHRAVLTPVFAEEILAEHRDDLGPRGMFESESDYQARLDDVAAAVQANVQSAVVRRFGAVLTQNDEVVTASLDRQGTYDIDANRYTTSVMGVRAELAIAPRDAEQLYLNWADASVEAQLETDDSGARVFGDYQLVHPTTGTRYPLLIEEDPLSGRRFQPQVSLSRPVELTHELILENLHLDPVFPALYRAYESYPIGTAIFRNAGDSPLEDLEVTATLAQYSVGEGVLAAPDAVSPGQRFEVPVTLVLSEDIVAGGGDETLSLRIGVSHRTGSSRRVGQMNTLVPILNRNAIRWDDDRKVGAFMTVVQSPVIMGLAGQAANDVAELSAGALPREFLVAMRVFEMLRARQIAYRVDPASAYTELSQSSGAIDFLQFPAETLAYQAGDCDDLSVLYNSIVEGAGVRTAFITTPGHIYAAFALQRAPDLLGASFADTDELIVAGDVAWIPVETTMFADGFRAAWQTGAREWRAAEANRTGALIPTAEAWAAFPPVPWEAPSQAIAAGSAKDDFQSELDGYVDDTVGQIIADRGVAEPQTAQQYNVRGTIYARFGMLDEAEADFQRAYSDAQYIPSMVNLASIASLRGDHERARELLEEANDLTPNSPRILLGLAVQHIETGERGSARSLYDRVTELDPELASTYPLFGSSNSQDRAAEADATRGILEDAWW